MDQTTMWSRQFSHIFKQYLPGAIEEHYAVSCRQINRCAANVYTGPHTTPAMYDDLCRKNPQHSPDLLDHDTGFFGFQNVICVAAQVGNYALIKHVILENKDIPDLANLADSQGITPLMYAVDCPSPRNAFLTCKTLCELGADVNLIYMKATERPVITPLYKAIQNDNLFLMQYLMMQKAKVYSPLKYWEHINVQGAFQQFYETFRLLSLKDENSCLKLLPKEILKIIKNFILLIPAITNDIDLYNKKKVSRLTKLKIQARPLKKSDEACILS